MTMHDAAYPVLYQSRFENVYHCCAPKTASQWIMAIFSDPRVFMHSGLKSYHFYQNQANDEQTNFFPKQIISKPFPAKTICTPLYLNYESYQDIPKPENFRTFFVMRDPRDIVVSWYFSLRKSHPTMGPIHDIRERLLQLTVDDGLSYSIEKIAEVGIFDSMMSWQSALAHDEHVTIFRFEDLTDPSTDVMARCLFLTSDVRLPRDLMKQVLSDYSFDRLSGGRRVGVEDQSSHYRKGVAGGWTEYFTGRTERVMRDVTGGLVSGLGYSW